MAGDGVPRARRMVSTPGGTTGLPRAEAPRGTVTEVMVAQPRGEVVGCHPLRGRGRGRSDRTPAPHEDRVRPGASHRHPAGHGEAALDVPSHNVGRHTSNSDLGRTRG